VRVCARAYGIPTHELQHCSFLPTTARHDVPVTDHALSGGTFARGWIVELLQVSGRYACWWKKMRTIVRWDVKLKRTNRGSRSALSALSKLIAHTARC